MRKVRLFVDIRTGEFYYAHTVKELRAQIGNGGSRVRRMFVDSKDGNTYHTGYVIGKRWLKMYKPDWRKV